jgi:glycine dehydrogenase subunit 1
MSNTRELRDRLGAIDGIRGTFDRPSFHEATLTLRRPAQSIIDDLARSGIIAGVALGEDYPELGDALLVCATETKTIGDIERFVVAMRAAL